VARRSSWRRPPARPLQPAPGDPAGPEDLDAPDLETLDEPEEVTSLLVFEGKMLAGVFGPVLLGLWLFRRSRGR
jgi:hypothetical protein